MKPKQIAAFVVLGILFILGIAFNPFTIVGAGQRGVIVTFGKVSDTILDEGLHLVNPIASVKKVAVQTTVYSIESSAASKDMQTATTTIAVNYHLNPGLVNKMYQNIKGDYETTIVAPAVQDSVKTATAMFTAYDLLNKRSEVADAVKTSLTEKLAYYAVIDAISMTNFEFSPAFNASIERKAVAEQDALTAKNLLEQKKYEAEQTVVTATADAESIRIKGEALKENSQLVQLEWVAKWNGVLPTTVLGDAVPMINLQQ